MKTEIKNGNIYIVTLRAKEIQELDNYYEVMERLYLNFIRIVNKSHELKSIARIINPRISVCGKKQRKELELRFLAVNVRSHNPILFETDPGEALEKYFTWWISN